MKGRKGHYRELFESLAKKGYIYARIDGEIREISAGMRLDRYKIHTYRSGRGPARREPRTPATA